MATDDTEAITADASDDSATTESLQADERVVAGRYSWVDYLRDYGYTAEADRLDEQARTTNDEAQSERAGDAEPPREPITVEDVRAVGLDPATFLGFDPEDLSNRLAGGADLAERITDASPLIGYDETPVYKGVYSWKHYEEQYARETSGGLLKRGKEEPEEFTEEDRTDALGMDQEAVEERIGFDPGGFEETLGQLGHQAEKLADVVDERTVDVHEELDEDAFFRTAEGVNTVVSRYDLEKAVPLEKKTHFREEERYWVNEPYSFVIIFHSTKENEKKYYVIEPHLNAIEEELTEFLEGKLRSAIKYADEGSVASEESHRTEVIQEETYNLLERYDLYDEGGGSSFGNTVANALSIDPDGTVGRLLRPLGIEEPTNDTVLEGSSTRPEPAVLEDDPDTLTEYSIKKLLYYLERDFIGYERIDGIKHDINVEDISCDGYNSPVFVYHSDYEQIISNIYHAETELDDFVVKLAQRSGKGISKRSPQVDATLPDGSRAQLTLGKEVSDHGTNYTIRQFKDVPFTPIDLINWTTFSLDEMAFLWLCIENHKSLIFAGGTASGKTTSLNAVSLFIPSNAKIVSIEDTREVELPQRNWIASVTRPSFSEDDKGDVDEFDLLEAALRQRPDYIVMGEIRGEEGRTLFQVMSTGHTTYTTFHADSVGEVLKRFTTDPINVSKTMFTALDLVSIQTSTRVNGQKVRRNKSLTEINHYDAENDEINVQDVYQWQAETDEFLEMGDSNILQEIAFDRGWSRPTLDEELLQRRAVIAYLIDRGLNTYSQVAATFQAFINDPDTILALMANDELEESLEDLREMESVLINVDPEKEEMVPRPDPNERTAEEAKRVLEQSEDMLAEYRGVNADSVLSSLSGVEPERTVEAEPIDETEAESTGVDDPFASASPIDTSPTDPFSTADPSDAQSTTGSVPGADDERTFEAIDQFSDDANADVDGDELFDEDIWNDDGGRSDGNAANGNNESEETEDEPIEDWGFGEVEESEDE